MQEYEVRTTVVKRTTVRHRVFADTKAEAIALVIRGKGERLDRPDVKVVEGPSQSAKKVRTRHA